MIGKEIQSNVISYWQEFYQKHFGIKIDLSNLKIPELQEDFTWAIITMEQVNEQMLYERCQELFSCWKWTGKSLNEDLASDATSKGTHIAFFRNRVEADEELKKLSTEDLEKKGVQGITLKQRLVMELDYFSRTEKHLDIQNVTLCAGSRYSDGDAPVVDWNDGKMRVLWGFPYDRCNDLRSRQAVSFV